MQVSPDELMAEAGQLALECRLKDRVIAGLQAENAALRAQLEPPDTRPADGEDLPA